MLLKYPIFCDSTKHYLGIFEQKVYSCQTCPKVGCIEKCIKRDSTSNGSIWSSDSPPKIERYKAMKLGYSLRNIFFFFFQTLYTHSFNSVALLKRAVGFPWPCFDHQKSVAHLPYSQFTSQQHI